MEIIVSLAESVWCVLSEHCQVKVKLFDHVKRYVSWMNGVECEDSICKDECEKMNILIVVIP